MILRGILCLSFLVLLAPHEPYLGVSSNAVWDPLIQRARETVVGELSRIRADIQTDQARHRR